VPPPLTKAELEAVYQAAWYEIKTPAGQCRRFRVGDHLPELDRLSEAAGWAWLTAFNPGSRLFDEAENHRRHQSLLEELTAGSWQTLEAASGDDHGQWPVERAVCVLGVDESAARKMAARQAQAAFLHARPGEGVRLCWV